VKLHGAEARHSVHIAVLNGGTPSPEAVDPALTMAEVLDIELPVFLNY